MIPKRPVRRHASNADIRGVESRDVRDEPADQEPGDDPGAGGLASRAESGAPADRAR